MSIVRRSVLGLIVGFGLTSPALAQTLAQAGTGIQGNGWVRPTAGTAKLEFVSRPLVSIDGDEAIVLVSVQATTRDARYSLPGFPIVVEARAASVVATAEAVSDSTGFARVVVRMPLPPSHLVVFVRAYGRYDPISSTGDVGMMLRRVGVELEAQLYALSNGLGSSLAGRHEPIEIGLGTVVTPRLSIALTSYGAHNLSLFAELPVIALARAPAWIPEGAPAPSAGSIWGVGDLGVGTRYQWADLLMTSLSFNTPPPRAVDRARDRLGPIRTLDATDGFRSIDTGAALVLPIGRAQFLVSTSRSVAWSRLIEAATERADPTFHASFGIAWLHPEIQSRTVVFCGYVALGGTRLEHAGSAAVSVRARIIDRLIGVSWERRRSGRVQSTVTAFVGGLGTAAYFGATYGITMIVF